ncbi:FAD-dependent oxidoreductase [uncultured Cohaesibacter sp.]|uniref:dihydrolipoyl dehydrogenase family protein n=1 Tax=uncultured Cohaesibacter sp. TaxID=1002546 RepID=UPI0029313FC6|nr:FAD-dependent oxidoreductase [uncultured Cohaesibacter sp.]
MTDQIQADICVIGAGSGGLTVAAVAAAFGEKVVLLEKGAMGGDCLNFGCVPSKALIASAKQAQAMRQANQFGVCSVEPRIDYQAVHDHVHSVMAAIAPNDSVARFEGLGVTVIQKAGRFKDPKTVVTADGETEIKARAFVIATGSSPRLPEIEGLSDVKYLTNETFFSLTSRPDKLVILGGGPIGMELAQAQRRLGAEVSVLEAYHVLGRDDPEMSSLVVDQLRREGVDIKEGVKVLKIERPDDPDLHPHGAKIHVSLSASEETSNDVVEVIEASHLLVATGRKPNMEGLGLEDGKIRFDAHGIRVNQSLRTSNRRVYAIGDVLGGPQFTHVASYHASLVVRSILFRFGGKMKEGIIPQVTFTDPEMAQVGYSEEAAQQKFKAIRILRWPYGENDRAQAERKTTGFIKVILNKKGIVIGASVVGANAGEIINMWSLIISQKMPIKAVTGFLSPYPTYSEIGRRAAISNYMDLPAKPSVRKVISYLKKFR